MSINWKGNMIVNFKETRRPRSQVQLEVAVTDLNPLIGGFTIKVDKLSNGEFRLGMPLSSVAPALNTTSPPPSHLIHTGVYDKREVENIKELFKKQLPEVLKASTIMKDVSSYKLRGI